MGAPFSAELVGAWAWIVPLHHQSARSSSESSREVTAFDATRMQNKTMLSAVLPAVLPNPRLIFAAARRNDGARKVASEDLILRKSSALAFRNPLVPAPRSCPCHLASFCSNLRRSADVDRGADLSNRSKSSFFACRQHGASRGRAVRNCSFGEVGYECGTRHRNCAASARPLQPSARSPVCVRTRWLPALFRELRRDRDRLDAIERSHRLLVIRHCGQASSVQVASSSFDGAWRSHKVVFPHSLPPKRRVRGEPTLLELADRAIRTAARVPARGGGGTDSAKLLR
ncbi:uncharacterized protein PAN0_003c1509 [Moesziomyces antarcticus]|uniref:uncharacterized protein n=1 Tax=Pseudozyma antarctica TaxID=84753 RepID=UPI0007196365|nr:uncharacterized protein PAN0_003c1509 [Moesziomyces antarcticus]GAK63305.1 hypothetical protein PAN0_003c1509 [Moesziomyces antarcticus]